MFLTRVARTGVIAALLTASVARAQDGDEAMSWPEGAGSERGVPVEIDVSKAPDGTVGCKLLGTSGDAAADRRICVQVHESSAVRIGVQSADAWIIPAAPAGYVPSEAVDPRLNTIRTYPLRSAKNKEQGTVTVRFVVTEKGRTDACTIAKSSGFEGLDSATCAAVKQFRYKPATLNGKAVREVRLIPVGYYLTRS